MNKIIELYKRNASIWVYLFFGCLTTVVNYIVYIQCSDILLFSAAYSNIIAWAVAVLFAFLTNKPFVFKSNKWTHEVVVPELTKFVSCRIASGVAETIFLLLTVDCLSLNGKIMKLVASAFVMVLNYISSKWIAFKM